MNVVQEATYLISGGLSGFGLATAEALVKLGCRHLILVSRRGETPDNKASLTLLRETGVEVKALACDISDASTFIPKAQDLLATMPPLKGIIHAAACLKDVLITNMQETDLKVSMAPKIGGAMILDQFSRDYALDFFIVYSSVTTLLGNPGQGNYVASNLAMENLVALRRNQGLPGLALGFGAILDHGMLTRDPKTLKSLQERTGLVPYTAEEALNLAFSLEDPPAYLALFAADFKKLARLPIARQPRFSPLILAQDLQREAQGSFKMRLEKAAPEDRGNLILEELKVVLAKILHTSFEQIQVHQPLQAMGLDSLMGVELSLALEDMFSGNIAGGFNAQMTLAELSVRLEQALEQQSGQTDMLDELGRKHGVTVAPLLKEQA